MSSEKKGLKDIAIVALTKNGVSLAGQLGKYLINADLFIPAKFTGSPDLSRVMSYSSPVKSLIGNIFNRYKYLILIMAAGAAVRLIAPLINNKYKDPGVVVMDEKGKYVISLLSGHIGGANALTRRISQYLKSQPVITTASDINNGIAIDLLGSEYGWEIENKTSLKKVAVCLVNKEPVAVYQDAGETDWQEHYRKAQPNLKFVTELKQLEDMQYKARIIITDRTFTHNCVNNGSTVIFRPKSLVVGIGCNRGTGAAEIQKALYTIMQQQRLGIKNIRNFATAELKQGEEGILQLSHKLDIPVTYYSSSVLRKVQVLSPPSATVMQHAGTPSVCEAAAMLSSDNGELVVKKTNFFGSVSIAIARVKYKCKSPQRQGKIYLVGLGPGAEDQMTLRAKEILELCNFVVGYDTYIRQVRDLIYGKEIIASGMGKEIERAIKAIELAERGEPVAILCGGDSGIYGMASLVAEIIAKRHLELDLEIVPGVPAFVAAAALLGAPLNNDFACISLSDYLVSSKTILQRIEAAAKSDFVIALYNPASSRRKKLLSQVKETILQFRPPSTTVGIVQNAFRPGENVIITDLDKICEYPVDMNTLLIIGNSGTFRYHNWMITARGYLKKYDLYGGKSHAVDE